MVTALVMIAMVKQLLLSPLLISEQNGMYVVSDRFPSACQGSTDDSALFAYYSYTLPSGGTLVLPKGQCHTRVGLVFGEGTPQVNSARQGIKVLGQGSGFNEGELGPFVTTGTTIDWIGTYDRNAAMVRFVGPGSNFRIEDISLNGRGAAGYGVKMEHIVHPTANRLTLRNFTVTAFINESTAAARSGMATGAGDGVFSKIQVFTSTPGAIGIIAGADDTNTVGSSGNHWDRVTVLCGVRQGSIGMLIRFTDYVKFSLPQTLYCEQSIRFQSPSSGPSRTFFPTGIYIDEPALDKAPTWSVDWSPYPNIGAVLTNYHREWDGGLPANDTSYGPPFPTHASIRGTDSLGNVYITAPLPKTRVNGAEVEAPPTMRRRAPLPPE